MKWGLWLRGVLGLPGQWVQTMDVTCTGRLIDATYATRDQADDDVVGMRRRCPGAVYEVHEYTDGSPPKALTVQSPADEPLQRPCDRCGATIGEHYVQPRENGSPCPAVPRMVRALFPRICALDWCGRSFVPTHDAQTHCSDRCLEYEARRRRLGKHHTTFTAATTRRAFANPNPPPSILEELAWSSRHHGEEVARLEKEFHALRHPEDA